MTQGTLILGCPGSGKTARLLETLEELLTDGLDPRRVAVVSFTRAAVREVCDRVRSRFSLDLRPQAGGNVGTVHSLAYWGLGVGRAGGIFGHKEWRTFCEERRLPYTPRSVADDAALEEPWEPQGVLPGDVFRAWYDWARNGLLDLDEAAHRYDPGYAADFAPEYMLALASAYEETKRRANKPDFCDLLIRAYDSGLTLGVSALLVDECQDLSPLQRRLVEMWGQRARTWWFGDPDQSIYGWQHAEPSWMLDIPERAFLDQSHRVPRRVAAEAQTLIGRNQRRYDQAFRPRDAEGAVSRDLDVSQLVARIANDGQETWGLLARNRYLLARYTEALQAEALPYINLRGASPVSRVPAAVLTAFRLAAGRSVALRDVARLAAMTAARGNWENKAALERAAKAQPQEQINRFGLDALGALPVLLDSLSAEATALSQLGGLDVGRRRYYVQVVQRRGLDALERRQANVTVSTIHGVKGREYDNVALLPDWATRTSEGAQEDAEAERRVWYTGITRTRSALYVLAPVGRQFNSEVC